MPIDLSTEEAVSLNEVSLSRNEFFIDSRDDTEGQFMAMYFARGVVDTSGKLYNFTFSPLVKNPSKGVLIVEEIVEKGFVLYDIGKPWLMPKELVDIIFKLYPLDSEWAIQDVGWYTDDDTQEVFIKNTDLEDYIVELPAFDHDIFNGTEFDRNTNLKEEKS